jgi:uncharacterized protein YdhG (YjbR/CyaY superfamily)
MEPKTSPANADAYIAAFPPATKKLLQQLRTAIKKAAPLAEEVISYQMPAYKYHGILVYFAGHKNHIGFYPTASGIENFKKEIAGFKNSKGAIQLPFDQPLPVSLITAMVKFRVQVNLEKASIPPKKKK